MEPHGRLGIARHIGVPLLALQCVFGLLVCLNDKDIGVVWKLGERSGVHVQLAKAAAKFFRMPALGSSFDHEKKITSRSTERIMNFLELLIAKRFGQVSGTKDLSADIWRCVAHPSMVW